MVLAGLRDVVAELVVFTSFEATWVAFHLFFKFDCLTWGWAFYSWVGWAVLGKSIDIVVCQEMGSGSTD